MKKTLFSLLYWFLQLTWDLPLTLIGGLMTLGALCFGGHIHKNGCTFITEIGGNWGGLEMGAFAFCGRYSEPNGPCYDMYWYEHTRRHEFGHTLQSAVLSILFVFIVTIPSAIRYWYKRIEERKGRVFPSDWYDSIWFEGTATKYGEKIVDWLEVK